VAGVRIDEAECILCFGFFPLAHVAHEATDAHIDDALVGLAEMRSAEEDARECKCELLCSYQN
jgi:hypothetical protein